MKISEYSVPMEDYLKTILPQGDKRVEGWAFMDSPSQTIYTFITYLCFVWLGPKYMRDRKPFDLKAIMLMYNICQIVLSFHMFKEFLTISYSLGYSYVCQNMDFSTDAKSIQMARTVWLFYVSKFIDLLDTEEKQSNQFSARLPSWYNAIVLGSRKIWGRRSHMVHTIMYTYYTLSSLGPAIQPYLWWKKYLTQLQLTQFFLIVCHIGLGFYKDCDYPHFLGYFSLINVATFIILFINFYVKAYLKESKRKKGIHAISLKNGNISNGQSDCIHQHLKSMNGVVKIVNGHYANGYHNSSMSNGVIKPISNGIVKSVSNKTLKDDLSWINNSLSENLKNGRCANKDKHI